MTKTTPLLDQLSQAAREEASEDLLHLDERWDRLAAGTLNEEEHDELLGLSDATGEAHQAYQAFKPLGPAFQRNVAAAIAAQKAAEKIGTATDPSTWVAPSAMRRRSLLFGAFASAASLVVGALLVFPLVAPMSAYTSKQLKGADVRRGADQVGEDFDGIPRFQNSNVVELISKASVPPGMDIEARLYTFGADSKLQLTPLKPKIENDGSLVTFDPILGKGLVLPPGRWDLVVVISRPEKFPDEATLIEAMKSNGPWGKYWQALVTTIQVEKDE